MEKIKNWLNKDLNFNIGNLGVETNGATFLFFVRFVPCVNIYCYLESLKA